MTKRDYEICMTWTRKHIGIQRVRLLVKLLTILTAVLYGVVLVQLLLQGDRGMLLRMLLIPAAGFLAVSLFRSLRSASRPYERYGFTPLLEKDTHGKSFPSRHVFSNMIIAMAVLSVNLPAGIFLIFCGIGLAVLRVVTGVHFPGDVVAGGLAAVLLGLLGFFAV